MLKAVLNEAWKLAPFRVAVVHYNNNKDSKNNKEEYDTHSVHIITPSSKENKRDMIQASTHWNTTTKNAHFPPSSLLMEAIAATHGV